MAISAQPQPWGAAMLQLKPSTRTSAWAARRERAEKAMGHCTARATHTGREHPHGEGLLHQPPPLPPMPETGSGAANSLTVIINFMHILCKPLVHRQDGIDLIRISIIEPFGRQLLIRESVKHRRGWGSEGLSGDGQTLSSEQSEPQPPPLLLLPQDHRIRPSAKIQPSASPRRAIKIPHPADPGLLTRSPCLSFPN